MLAAQPAPPARYLALGDSYTIGESVPVAARWPNQLAELLRAQGVELAPPQIVARTGWTTDELAAALDALERGDEVANAMGEAAVPPAPPYQLVSLLIGVNNQYRGREVAEYRVQLDALIARAIGYAGGDASRVLVLSIPDWGVTPFAEGRERARITADIDAYNAAKRATCAAAGVAFVDITPLTREAAERPELLADDGLHPSAQDYRRWAQAALPAARAALGLSASD
ncbi:MAG: SGNH/GDSL hydrolase family protein [Xanthomonadales bacterium PRO6]|nr:SGNH/GDSL hydrolase family protein [Xanthomonadales bacterium PRO6]